MPGLRWMRRMKVFPCEAMRFKEIWASRLAKEIQDDRHVRCPLCRLHLTGCQPRAYDQRDQSDQE